MELSQANALADALMETHGVKEKGWKFQFDRASRRFGCCNYRRSVISLSRALTQLNDEAEVRNTILHEIAHAIVGRGVGHGPVWKAKHIEIGGDGQRCYKWNVHVPEKRYTATCLTCNQVCQYAVNRGAACGRCCRKYSNGRFDPKYKFVYTLRTEPTFTFSPTVNIGERV